MSEELGNIERPLAEEFRPERKLFFVPLIFASEELPAEFLEMVNRYWEQVQAQVASLESKLGDVSRVYHELIPPGDEEGSNALGGVEELNTGSHSVVRTRVEKGAKLQSIEDGELLAEYVDWGNCLAAGLQNQRVFDQVYSSYVAVQRRREEHIAKRVDETLEKGGTGLLLMREGQGVQFPRDIRVFYIAPLALDEIRRWLRARQSEAET